MNNYFIEIIISLIIYITVTQRSIKCDTIKVTARCGRPAVPAKATNHLVSPERSRFENKEKVIILCQKEEFPLLKHDLECLNGRWFGKLPRCGQHVEAQVKHLDISECQTSNYKLLVSQPLNLSLDLPPGYNPLPPNSYHTLRVSEGMKTSANGSNCYIFKVTFERKVQIWFIFVEIWVEKSDPNITLHLKPFVSKYRNCVLHEKKVDYKGADGTIFRNHFICDLNNDTDLKKEELEMPDTISFSITTNFLGEVGLDAVSIGDIFRITSGSRKGSPDCGQIQIQNIGIDAQEEVLHKYITCNDSFVDFREANVVKSLSPSGNPIHKFTCNQNGVWTGDWPQCVPKKACPQENIFQDMDSSVSIEEIGNLYYLNESKWFAVNDSFIRYVCAEDNAIMVGSNIRMCMKNGKWNTKSPYCSKTGISGLGIAGILFAVLIVFVFIVLIVFRMHSKRVKRELRETRNEITETTRKRYSDEFYADTKETDFYDMPEHSRKSMQDYETVDYNTFPEQPRYESDPHHKRPPEPEYLDMLSLK